MSSPENPATRLLLCSSNLENLEPLRQRLTAAGTEVDCATQAEQARRMLWETHYDGVAVDLLLADRDGISFAMELRHEHPWVSLLVISSTTQNPPRTSASPDWLNRSTEYARLIFALKQAGQRSAGRAPKILHVEDDDTLADLVKNTIGKQTQLFRARSAQEARIAMALRSYDLALIRTETPQACDWAQPANGPRALTVNTDANADPVLSLLNHLRRNPYIHEPAYC